MAVARQDVVPTLRITHYERSRAFYEEGLGFTVDWEWRHAPELPVFLQVRRGELALYLSEHEGDCRPGGCVHLYVPDVDELHAELHDRGVPIASPPTDQAWGNRDMVVLDPDGNRLVWCTPLHPPV